VTREVLPPRRVPTLRGLLLIGALTGCAAHIVATATPTPSPTQGYPLSVWEAPSLHETEFSCAPTWSQPATLCLGGNELTHDGCSWSCTPIIKAADNSPRWKPWP
jgi:hypothetical protein